MSHNNWRDFLRAVDQMNKIRALLNAPTEPVEEIVRPKGMRRARYQNLRERLVRAEHRTSLLLGREIRGESDGM